LVATRSLGLEFPDEIAAHEIARLERAVKYADVHDVAGNRRRREHESLGLALDQRFPGRRVEHVVEARVGRPEDHLALHDCRRADHPASAVVEAPYLGARSCIERIEVTVPASNEYDTVCVRRRGVNDVAGTKLPLEVAACDV